MNRLTCADTVKHAYRKSFSPLPTRVSRTAKSVVTNLSETGSLTPLNSLSSKQMFRNNKGNFKEISEQKEQKPAD
jgi:hypothetical protein